MNQLLDCLRITLCLAAAKKGNAEKKINMNDLGICAYLSSQAQITS